MTAHATINTCNVERELRHVDEHAAEMIWEHGNLWEWSDNTCVAPEATNWFFCLSAGRTGSCAVAQVLSMHPDVYCGNEEDWSFTVGALLRSERLMSRDGDLRHCGHRNNLEATPRAARCIMEGIRNASTDKPLFGNKTLRCYWQPELIDWLLDIFPGALLLTTHRNILDALSSWLEHNWITSWGSDEALFSALRVESEKRLAFRARTEQLGAYAIRFERCITREEIEAEFSGALEHIGARVDDTQWDDAEHGCLHANAVGRWRTDRAIRAFDSWLGGVDEGLRAAIHDS